MFQLHSLLVLVPRFSMPAAPRTYYLCIASQTSMPPSHRVEGHQNPKELLIPGLESEAGDFIKVPRSQNLVALNGEQ